jgi:hypothetical protein
MYRNHDESWYDAMQVCLNGHCITEYAESQRQHRQNFCAECGEKTIDSCLLCNVSIRGHYHVPGVLNFSSTPVPKYCFHCGKPYPWQAAAIENFREVLAGSELSAQDLQDVDKALPDVIRDTPKTQSASLRMKRILEKVGKPLYDVALKVFTDVASESAKKTLGLN